MEKMPFRPELARAATMATPATIPTTPSTEWRTRLPVLTSARYTLRELDRGDAPALLELLATQEVSRFISPPPTTVEGFERFIEWTHQERAAGTYFSFAIVPEGVTRAVGLFQVRALEPSFGTAEWGFVLGSGYWGSGCFTETARLVLDFVFETVGVHRLEARAAVVNGRGNGALRKMGAVQEGVLRRAFQRNGQCHDQVLWSILREDWRLQRMDRRLWLH